MVCSEVKSAGLVRGYFLSSKYRFARMIRIRDGITMNPTSKMVATLPSSMNSAYFKMRAIEIQIRPDAFSS